MTQGRRVSFGRQRAAALAILFALACGSAQAGILTFYPTRDAFNAAEPGLPVQSFDGANLYGQSYVTQANPLTPSTNDAVFSTGSILPGLWIKTQHPGSESDALLVYAGGPVGAVSVGNYWFEDTLVLDFRNGVSAVAFNLFGNTAASTSFAVDIYVQFLSGKRPIGAKTFHEGTGQFIFLGVSSAGYPITRVLITWASDEDSDTFVSDIAFGTPAPAR